MTARQMPACRVVLAAVGDETLTECECGAWFAYWPNGADADDVLSAVLDHVESPAGPPALVLLPGGGQTSPARPLLASVPGGAA